MGHILLTGVAGFIGAETAVILLEEGHKVTGIDNMNDYYSVALKEWRLKKLEKYDNFTFHKGDIENYEYLKLLFETNKFTAVINLAARAGVRYSEENPFIYMSTNATGTLNLLELMRKYDTKKFVLASTSSLYAGQDIPFSERLPVNTPISQYAATKKAAEAMAYTYHHLYGIDVSICRYFTVYGPAGRPDMSPYRFVKWVIEKEPITLYGDGNQSRDFTFVTDIAQGTVEALKEVGYEIINLGGGKKPIKLNAMITLIEEFAQTKAIINFQPAQKTDMLETMADIDKAKRILNWEPQIDFEEGLEKTVFWYLNNRDWLKNI
ncbi:MAG: nucleotide sugar epimerase [Spirochaetes bacterium GWF1_31_7]|nr:MAG: nucleotide sugar epimerase [Spirochaetes bacterium GWE1_32_154]OHD49944.1 MAG: nucleotide sugar epimerase [Spirochaetes bacterium GWE2_31_10]OHD52262.1 MAG: nucleotide sugar epimerase [Spirochaetes bacterium GWF1_31_7]OHD72999.1 MAG: nucleotide sugar epimerase [Spirochaetes bacterium RIFOXYB1_FULL_32_8]HBD92599.1 nucleotide sugar epimerase [Spirochaetia bacterium]